MRKTHTHKEVSPGKWINLAATETPIESLRSQVCQQIGCDVYARTKQFLRMCEFGYHDEARLELLALLQWFPPAKKVKT